MTYLQFHLAFILPPIIALALLRPFRASPEGRRAWLRSLGLVLGAALVATTPWDNYLVYRGVWNYGPDRVIGTIGYVPVEEYLFFVLQPILVGTFYALVRRRMPPAATPLPAWFPVTLIGAFLLLTAAGVVMLSSGTDRWVYGGLILSWAPPIIAGMCYLGVRHVWFDWIAITASFILPTLYLWVADAIAIRLGIWSISSTLSTHILVAGLPVEEALFFAITSVLCVFGLALLLPVRTPDPSR